MKNLLVKTVKRKRNDFICDFLWELAMPLTEMLAYSSYSKFGDDILFKKFNEKKLKHLIKSVCKAFAMNKKLLISVYIYDLKRNQLLFKTTSASFPNSLFYKEEEGQFYSHSFNALRLIDEQNRII